MPSGNAPKDESGRSKFPFAPQTSIVQVKERAELATKFQQGLISAVTTADASFEVLMMGVMTAEALQLTIEIGEAHYWSRSRQCLWHKGATSGLIQKVVEMRIDDDQDAIWLGVEVVGGASCHVGTGPASTAPYRSTPQRDQSR